ncbi:hypothetical protein VZT92_006997 [Zoarces viviparus]|uniref:Uncharacterized protein n=1 Tax=Zoarces viviparus TaxID=48416 RepID=A0AAW1FK89_ZOAVI
MDATVSLIEGFRWTRSSPGSVHGLSAPPVETCTFLFLMGRGLRHEEDSPRTAVKIARIFHFEKWQSTQD